MRRARNSEPRNSFCATALTNAPPRRRYDHLNELVKTTEGMPSSGMVKRIIARRGVLCQVCWRRRWFRAEVMRVYPTSLLFKWHDWSDSD